MMCYKIFFVSFAYFLFTWNHNMEIIVVDASENAVTVMSVVQ